MAQKNDGSRHTATRYSASGGGGAVTTTDTYDALGRLSGVATTLPSGPLGTVSYTYDDAGNKASATANGLTTAYVYDPDDRLWQVIQNGSTIATYGYDKDGNRRSLTRANGVVTAYGYDSLNRLTDVRNSVGSSYHYVLRADGKRLSVTDAGGTTSYGYDGAGRLSQESGPAGTIAYTYDNVGNRLTRTVSNSASPSALPDGTTAYGYDHDDRLTNQAYDANGNQLSVNGQVASYDWQNKLTSLGTSQNPTATAAYLYDADGNRVGVATSGGTTTDLWDTSLDFPSVVAEYVNGSLSASYAYGDDLISQTRTGTTSYYVLDGLGSVRALTNAGGSVTDTYLYDAFGDGLTESGPTVNPFLFDAQQYDAPTGDYYLRARYYDTTTGRFLSQDPYDGDSQDPVSLHRYLYTGDDPTDEVDPGGRMSLGEVLDAIYIGITINSSRAAVAVGALQFVAGIIAPETTDALVRTLPPNPFDTILTAESSVGRELGEDLRGLNFQESWEAYFRAFMNIVKDHTKSDPAQWINAIGARRALQFDNPITNLVVDKSGTEGADITALVDGVGTLGREVSTFSGDIERSFVSKVVKESSQTSGFDIRQVFIQLKSAYDPETVRNQAQLAEQSVPFHLELQVVDENGNVVYDGYRYGPANGNE